MSSKNPAWPSRNRMTARVNDERRNFGASYNFRVHQALGNLAARLEDFERYARFTHELRTVRCG